MKSKALIIMLAAFSLTATSASAQRRGKNPMRVNVTTRTAPTQQSNGPARASALIQVVGGDRSGFDSKRAKLIDDSDAALRDISDAKTKSGAALTNRLSSLDSWLWSIESNSRALSSELNPRAVTGKTRTAREHIAKVQRHHASALTHLAAAKKATREGKDANAQRAISSLETQVRAISSMAGKLALLEPVVHR